MTDFDWYISIFQKKARLSIIITDNRNVISSPKTSEFEKGELFHKLKKKTGDYD